MFGYIVANKAALDEQQLLRYRACYCGLCRSLKQRHGSLARATLSYDMTFTVLLLSSLYEPEEQQGRERCLTHPLKAHDYWQNRYSDYAADINIALSYFKCQDDWQDERKLPEYCSARYLQRAYGRVKQDWPRQCAAMESSLNRLSQLEAQNCACPDVMANIFGELMAELFVYQEDNWATILRNMGGALGVFIYILDACVDMERDRKKGLYNPLLAFAEENNGQAPEQQSILTMLMGEAAEQFELLPLVQDIGLLRNVVYSGVWQRYKGQVTGNSEE